MPVDLILKNGRIVDGTGLPSYIGDIAIKGGRIVEMGAVGESATRTINCDGLAVSPGFIDPHTHLDAQMLWDPLGTSSCYHGVTTVVMGNCSLSLHPCRPSDHSALIGALARVEAIPRSALEAALDWSWESTGQYLDRLQRPGLGINVAALLGHSALRQYVMGEDATERAATPEEIEGMKRVLRQSMLEGAIGFSANQNRNHRRDDRKPIPSRMATNEELLALAGVLKELNTGVVQTSRGLLDTEPEGQEVVLYRHREMALAAGRPLTFNALFHRWSKPDAWKEALEISGKIAAEGVPMYGLGHAQVMEQRFTMKNVQLFDGMPAWDEVLQGPLEGHAALLGDSAVRAKLQADVDDPTPKLFSKRWDTVYVAAVNLPHNKQYEELSVQDVAQRTGKTPLNAFLDLSLEERMECEFSTNITNGDPEAAAEILRQPHVLIGASDAGAHVAFDAGNGYCTNLLGYWVRERGIMSLERAVSRLTLQPARFFGFEDRGLLLPGLVADIAVFDPATVRPSRPVRVDDYPGNNWRWVQPAEGVYYTIVNGQVIVENGQATEARPGSVLRNSRARKLTAA